MPCGDLSPGFDHLDGVALRTKFASVMVFPRMTLFRKRRSPMEAVCAWPHTCGPGHPWSWTQERQTLRLARFSGGPVIWFSIELDEDDDVEKDEKDED